jgi:hypothetical protein
MKSPARSVGQIAAGPRKLSQFFFASGLDKTCDQDFCFLLDMYSIRTGRGLSSTNVERCRSSSVGATFHVPL